jgi:DNA primase
MGKISPVAAKYIIRAKFEADGIIERPDAIGAIFGQTEGLLGSDLELRELQKNGRIGRIEIITKSVAGKTEGTVEIPSSLDKSETAIIAAAVETIDRIGPCTAKIIVEKIEDVRIGKRDYILKRAKDLVKGLVEEMPDSDVITEDVSDSVKQAQVIEVGPDKLAAGPDAESANEVILVEGRADVLALLKAGYNNVISVGGTKVPPSLADLTKGKKITVFLDGDRGGDLILKELQQVVGEVESIARAPAGKEVEELNTKEVHICLRSKETKGDERRTYRTRDSRSSSEHRDRRNSTRPSRGRPPLRGRSGRGRPASSSGRTARLDESKKEALKGYLEEVTGSKGAILLDMDQGVLGKVPLIELRNTLSELEGVESVVVDGEVNKDITNIAESAKVKYLVGKTKTSTSRYVNIISSDDL